MADFRDLGVICLEVMTVSVEMVEVACERGTKYSYGQSLGKQHKLRDEVGRKRVGRTRKKQEVIKNKNLWRASSSGERVLSWLCHLFT